MHNFNDHLNFSPNLYDNALIRKKLSEQLQEKINILEAEIRGPEQIITLGKKAFEDAVEKLKAEQGVKFLSNEDLAHVAKTVYSPYVERAMKRENLIKRATEKLGDVAMTGDVETAQQYGDVMTDINRDLYTGKVAGLRNLDPADAARLKDLQSQNYEAARRNRERGIATNVPADTAAMRKFAAMGSDRYQAPFSQPEGSVNGMHVTPSHY
jgi:hypothetical protein